MNFGYINTKWRVKKHIFGDSLIKSKNINSSKKSYIMQNKNKFIKSIFSAECLKRKCFYHLLLYYTRIIELVVRFICDKDVKIKDAYLFDGCFSMQSHIMLPYMRGLITCVLIFII